jgi:ribonuclease D
VPDVPPEVPLIATAEGLGELVRHLRAEGRFAFDTEFVSEATYEPVLCLVQVATSQRLDVFDPLAIKDLAPFWDAVTDPAVEVIMHASGEDLRICRFHTGRLPERIVDVQVAAGLVGYGYPLSLGNLVRQELGTVLPGGETRTDWRRRPLSTAQVRYACDDVAHLLDLADHMGARLAEWGRTDWAEAEYRRLMASIDARTDDEERWRRLPGLHGLNRRGLESARRLAEWRREEARRQDRPIRQVLRDDVLVAIAKRQPAKRSDLEALRDFNRPHLLAKCREILDLIAQAQRVPADQLPEHSERFEEGPGLAMVVSLLSAALSRCCAEQRVSSALVGTTNDLKAVIRWHAEGQPETVRPDLLRGWREEVCGRTLLDILDGRCVLRVVDPTGDVPVALEPAPS